MSAYPLSAIVGLKTLVEALLVNAVAPEVGGVLVRGERGTAKSTAVRALAPLLPPVHAAAGEIFAFAPGERAPGGEVALDAPTAPRPAPLVELPLGTTLDRLVGSLDLGRALAGEQAFEAGLLARAHRGILYVDEVNLLPDHLVDALLDAAATGFARVEREAVSVVHAARFLLVGTMNAEEGELRPQLLDRFGLGVEVCTPKEPGVRAEIVRRRLAFERDPVAFARAWEEPEEALAARIATARVLLDAVSLPERELLRITGACAALGRRRRAWRHRHGAGGARPRRAGRGRRGRRGPRPAGGRAGARAPPPARPARRPRAGARGARARARRCGRSTRRRAAARRPRPQRCGRRAGRSRRLAGRRHRLAAGGRACVGARRSSGRGGPSAEPAPPGARAP